MLFRSNVIFYHVAETRPIELVFLNTSVYWVAAYTATIRISEAGKFMLVRVRGCACVCLLTENGKACTFPCKGCVQLVVFQVISLNHASPAGLWGRKMGFIKNENAGIPSKYGPFGS